MKTKTEMDRDGDTERENHKMEQAEENRTQRYREWKSNNKRAIFLHKSLGRFKLIDLTTFPIHENQNYRRQNCIGFCEFRFCLPCEWSRLDPSQRNEMKSNKRQWHRSIRWCDMDQKPNATQLYRTIPVFISRFAWHTTYSEPKPITSTKREEAMNMHRFERRRC